MTELHKHVAREQHRQELPNQHHPVPLYQDGRKIPLYRIYRVMKRIMYRGWPHMTCVADYRTMEQAEQYIEQQPDRLWSMYFVEYTWSEHPAEGGEYA